MSLLKTLKKKFFGDKHLTCIAQGGLELVVLLLQLPEGLDYRCIPPHTTQRHFLPTLTD
jgi:hypothetical protein